MENGTATAQRRRRWPCAGVGVAVPITGAGVLGPALSAPRPASRGAAVVLALVLAGAGAPVKAQDLTGALLSPEPDTSTRTGFSPTLRAPSGGFMRAPARTRPAGTIAATTSATTGSASQGSGGTGYDSLNRKRVRAKGADKSVRKGGTQASPSLPLAPTPGSTPMAAGSGQPNAVPSPANRERIAAGVLATVPGQLPRRRLRSEDDPFAAIGVRVGGFLLRPAIDVSAGYDSNPTRTPSGRGSFLTLLSPELIATSQWARHALNAEVRGSYSWVPLQATPLGRGAPRDLSRPNLSGKINGRVDLSRDSQIDLETRLGVGTDTPGSPDITAGLARYTLNANAGQSVGVTQRFNHLALTASGAVDRTVYDTSLFVDGSERSNADRNFTQYAALGRAAYEVKPGFVPFVEISADKRVRDVPVDAFGFRRSSHGQTLRAGTSFELTRLVTGEASLGYTRRSYDDARLKPFSGLIAAGSLIWTPTALTTMRLTAASTVGESTVPDVAAVVTRDYIMQVDHAFRRWLIGTARLGVSTITYEGSARDDRRYDASAMLTYKLTRTLSLKGEVRREWLTSSIAGNDYTANIVMVGLRLQR